MVHIFVWMQSDRPSDRDVNWMSSVQGKSPHVQVKEPYGNLDMVTCRLPSFKVHMPIVLERGSGSIANLMITNIDTIVHKSLFQKSELIY